MIMIYCHISCSMFKSFTFNSNKFIPICKSFAIIYFV